METITLDDGTILSGHCIVDGDILFLYLDGLSIPEGLDLITGKTSKIKAENHGNKHIYRGYNEIVSVSHEYGNCNVVLKKG